MWYFKTELEQHCFALSQPDEYFEVAADLERVRAEHAEILDQTAPPCAPRSSPTRCSRATSLDPRQRTKAAYSAWQKMQRKTQARDAPAPSSPPFLCPAASDAPSPPASPRRRSTT